MQNTTLPYRSDVSSAADMGFPVPGPSGCLYYANVLGEGDRWSWHCGSHSSLKEPEAPWDDNELVEVWSFGEQWSALTEPAYGQGYG